MCILHSPYRVPLCGRHPIRKVYIPSRRHPCLNQQRSGHNIGCRRSSLTQQRTWTIPLSVTHKDACGLSQPIDKHCRSCRVWLGSCWWGTWPCRCGCASRPGGSTPRPTPLPAHSHALPCLQVLDLSYSRPFGWTHPHEGPYPLRQWPASQGCPDSSHAKSGAGTCTSGHPGCS